MLFLDVVQGDAALLRTPGGANVLIDTGADMRTARELERQNIYRIDLLMLSHPHVDHIFVVTRCAREWPAAIESFDELFMLRNKQVVYAHNSAFGLTGSRPL